MKTLRQILTVLVLLGLCLTGSTLYAQDYNNRNNDQDDRGDNNYNQTSIDRYLDVEVWTDHADADYYIDDEVVIKFRANRDAFVAIYSIDSRGMVNLLFPSHPAQDNFVVGGVTFSLPGPADDFELVLNGPEGTETIQIVASQERFPIPDWYHNSGLVFEGDDVYDYMDYLNGKHFVRYGGQRFAFDRAVIFVNEWEPNYFRPVYYPDYPSWSVVGNFYVDYPWGSTVYINGYYWGVTPLYVPRIVVGWHTMTIYDRYGQCWENDFHVSRYHTSVFDRHVIVTDQHVRSKYKRVRTVGYRDPVEYGYTNYNKTVTGFKSRAGGSNGSRVVGNRTSGSRNSDKEYVASKKRFVRGESSLVKTKRGYETRTATTGKSRSGSRANDRTYTSGKSKSSKSGSSGSDGSYSSGSSKSSRSGSSYKSGSSKSSGRSSSGSSGNYYKKKSGSSSSKSKSSKSSRIGKSKSSGKKGSSSRTSKSSNKSPKIKKSKDSGKQSSGKGSEAKISKPAQTKSSPPAKRGSSSKKSSSSSSKGKQRR